MEEQTQKQKISPHIWVPMTLLTLFVIAQIANNVFDDNIENLLKQATEANEIEDYLIDDYRATPAKEYHFFDDKVFTDVFEFNDKGISVYKFSVETDMPFGNGGENFSYEIGRIYINPQDSKKSKCTYNYTAKFSQKKIDYFECSESQFIKSLPKIAEVKKEKFNNLKKELDEERQFEICVLNLDIGHDVNNIPACTHFKGRDLAKERNRLDVLHNNKLNELQLATLERK